MKKAQANFDAGLSPVVSQTLAMEISARDYLQIHWAEFTDDKIDMCLKMANWTHAFGAAVADPHQDSDGVVDPDTFSLHSYIFLKGCIVGI